MRWASVSPSRRRPTPPLSTCSAPWASRRTRAAGWPRTRRAGKAWKPRNWRTSPRRAGTAPRRAAGPAGPSAPAPGADPGPAAGPRAACPWLRRVPQRTMAAPLGVGAGAAGGAVPGRLRVCPAYPRRSAAGQGFTGFALVLRICQAVPRPVRGPGGGPFRAQRAEVAPPAPGTGTRREHLVGLTTGHPGPESLVGLAALGRDRFRALHVPAQRRLGVVPGVDLTLGQMMQLHPPARFVKDPRHGNRVQRKRHRSAGVIGAERAPAGLVVHHGEFGVPRAAPARIQPVDAPADHDLRGGGTNGPLHPQRLGRRIERGHVALYHVPGPGPVGLR